MCAVTWSAYSDGYDLFFNRDEAKSRGKARPPKVFKRQGVRYIARIDSDAGSTWLAVNEYDLSIALANSYAMTEHDSSELYRGGEKRSPENPPSGPVTTMTWDGSAAELVIEDDVSPPITTSADPQGRVTAARRELFCEMIDGGREVNSAGLMAFHRSHRPEKGILSPCMHHPNAGTESMSQVRLRVSEIQLSYAPLPPGVTPFSSTVHLVRR